MQNSKVNSGDHFEMGLWWSDQYHMDCSQYNLSLVPGSVCFIFSEASSQNCGFA